MLPNNCEFCVSWENSCVGGEMKFGIWVDNCGKGMCEGG